MWTYSNWLQPAVQNLLQCVVRFFHPRSSCMTTHISADVQRITLMCRAWRSWVEEPNNSIYSAITGFTSDFLSFIVVELIRLFSRSPSIIIINNDAVKQTLFYNPNDWQRIQKYIKAGGGMAKMEDEQLRRTGSYGARTIRAGKFWESCNCLI